MIGSMTPRDLLREWLAGRLEAPARAWLDDSAARLAANPDDAAVFSLFSSALRHTGKRPLSPTPVEAAMADALVPGWDPSDWTLDEAGRIYLLLALAPGRDSARLMDAIMVTADLGEAVALLKALPLLPDPLLHLPRAREGARSNAKSNFEAVALRNPYPALHFDETAWNQLVSKAIFVDSPLQSIQGLDRRANRNLNRLLMDLVAERRAAGRPIAPLLYRCLAPCAGDPELELIESALPSVSASDAGSILAALARNDSAGAQRVRAHYKPANEDPGHVR